MTNLARQSIANALKVGRTNLVIGAKNGCATHRSQHLSAHPKMRHRRHRMRSALVIATAGAMVACAQSPAGQASAHVKFATTTAMAK